MEYAEKGIVMDVTPHTIMEPYSDSETRKIFKQLTEAVDHLHQNGVIHGGETLQ
jgi:serine/threonine protein kinase